MRTLFDTDEEEIEGKASEITLSTASLLGIFFGLVLVCGVFFGFGYSIGRGTGTTAQARPVANPTAGNTGEAEEAATENPPAPVPAEQQRAQQQDHSQANAKAAPAPVGTQPQADERPREVPAPSENAAEPPASTRSEVAGAPVKPVDPARAIISKPSAQKATVLVAATGALNVSAAPGSGQPMVQIAAVARPEDANVLVSALRQRGYGAVVRNDPQDKLLHVQVGPF
ncbi:MAG: DedD protein, partial [Acidobacteriaceae bacterium]|nr:DedD protein [Acidobacteriaceae bacterium]